MKFRVYATLQGSITVKAKDEEEALIEATNPDLFDEFEFQWELQVEPEFDKDAVAVNP